ncbi:MAG: hypothetical protein LRY73_07095 [Bacillus sp. (in: Bacteria)]|nr:hypothetical protein [Bacillus sp. (in: firmicutes)]
MSANLTIKLLKTVCTETIGDVPTQLMFTGVALKKEDIREGYLYIPFGDEVKVNEAVMEVAIQGGAAAVLLEKESQLHDIHTTSSIPVFITNSVENAIQEMAKLILEEVDPPVIAVSGDQSGITADLTAAVLTKNYQVSRSLTSQSDWLGICLSIFNMDEDTDIFIAEYGLSFSGELGELSEIIEPNIALLPISSWELPFQSDNQSKEAVVREYGMIEKGMKASALALVDGDEPAVTNYDWKTDVVYCGNSENCVFQLVEMEEEGDNLQFQLKGIHMPFKVKKSLRPYIKNAVYAIGTAVHLGVLPDDMQPGLKEFNIKNNN